MKYNIEGGFDFYGELFSTLDKKDDDENDNMCLITGLSLENEHISLECNHKFNYLPLITEIYKQKYVYKTYDKIHLKDAMLDKFLKSGKDYFIRCPYCRNIQFEILPYKEDKEKTKYYGINTLDISFKKNIDITNGGKYYYGQYQQGGGFYHKGIQYKYINPGNCAVLGCNQHYCALNTEFNINYCYVHMGREIRKKIKEKKIMQKLEAKEKVKQEKLEAKEKAKQEKLEAKEKMKQEKAELKEKAKQEKEEGKKVKIKPVNSVISLTSAIIEYMPEVDETKNSCEAVLKTGINKGKICGAKSANPSISNLCKRHCKKIDEKEEMKVSKNVN